MKQRDDGTYDCGIDSHQHGMHESATFCISGQAANAIITHTLQNPKRITADDVQRYQQEQPGIPFAEWWNAQQGDGFDREQVTVKSGDWHGVTGTTEKKES